MMSDAESMLRQYIISFENKSDVPTLEDSLNKSLEEINKARENSEIMSKTEFSSYVKDHYSNSLTSTGDDDKVTKFTRYDLSNSTLNWQLWLALYNDSWVFKRAIDKPSQDCVRCGVTLDGEEDKKEVYRDLKKYQFDLIQLLQWGALFGGSVAVMMFDNFKNEDYKNRLDSKKVKDAKAMKLYVVDRWYGLAQYGEELVEDMTDQDFGKPKFYKVMFADGNTIVVHHDYVIRYEHRIAPKLIKNGQLQGWGYAEGAHIINELMKDDQFKTSIQSLINKSLIEVIKMSGMRGVFMGADTDNENQLRRRLEMVNWGRNFNSLTFLDKDDEYSMNSFGGLSGLSELLETNMWQISAALEMQGVLFGDLKQGFSNDVDAMERYDNTIQNRCESYYRPALTKLIGMLYVRYGINERVEYSFNSLLMKKQNKERLEALKSFQELLSGMLGDGAITTKQYAQAMNDYVTNNVVNLHISEEDLDELDDRFQEESEKIDFDKLSSNKDVGPDGRKKL